MEVNRCKKILNRKVSAAIGILFIVLFCLGGYALINLNSRSDHLSIQGKYVLIGRFVMSEVASAHNQKRFDFDTDSPKSYNWMSLQSQKQIGELVRDLKERDPSAKVMVDIRLQNSKVSRQNATAEQHLLYRRDGRWGRLGGIVVPSSAKYSSPAEVPID